MVLQIDRFTGKSEKRHGRITSIPLVKSEEVKKFTGKPNSVFILCYHGMSNSTTQAEQFRATLPVEANYITAAAIYLRTMDDKEAVKMLDAITDAPVAWFIYESPLLRRVHDGTLKDVAKKLAEAKGHKVLFGFDAGEKTALEIMKLNQRKS